MKHKSFLVCLLALFFAAAPVFAKKPVVALVLSGGGAKGLAEIPLLEALEDEGINVDMVLGTSMGAMVGGLYSAGYTPRQIRKIFLDLDIMAILNTSPMANKKLPIDPFDVSTDNIASLQFSEKGIGAAPAILGDQHIMNTLAEHFSRITSDIDFDSLPKRYRAMATDVTNAREIVIDHGSIVQAIRSSMSLPAVWTPAILGRKTYVIDGGWVDNLPIKVAKELGADIVIAMDVASHVESNPASIDNMTAVAVNLFNLTISTNAVAQHHLADLLLRPDLTQFNTLDFIHCREIIEVGEHCVAENREQLHKLALELEKMGVKLEKQNPTRTGEYHSLPELKVESVLVEDISFAESCPLPKPDDFKHYIGKVLDEETQRSLVRDLDKYQASYSLSSLSFEVRKGISKNGCILSIIANHYEQNPSRLVFGGLPSLNISWVNGIGSLKPYPNLSLGVFIANPVPFSAGIGFGDTTDVFLNVRPLIAKFGDYEFEGDAKVIFHEGSLEPKNSTFYKHRTVDDDYGLDTSAGVQLNLASFLTLRSGFHYSMNYVYSYKDKGQEPFFNLFSLYAEGIWNSMVNPLDYSGCRSEVSLEAGFSARDGDFLYNGRIRHNQAFELIQDVNSLGYEIYASVMRFPWELSASYADFGGFEGMTGYPYGTRRRDFALVGLNYQHTLLNIAGMRMSLLGEAKFGISSKYNPYTATTSPDDNFFSGWNPSDFSTYDLGFGAFLCFRTPIGCIIFGGSANLNGNFAFLIGLM